MKDEERERIANDALDYWEDLPWDYDDADGCLAAIKEALRLAIPADAVVVKREDLREIENVSLAGYGGEVEYACPVCEFDAGHAPDCWLAAALGES